MTRLSGEGMLESDVSGGGLEWVGGGSGQGGLLASQEATSGTSLCLPRGVRSQLGGEHRGGPRAPSTSAGSPACLVLTETQPPHP